MKAFNLLVFFTLTMKWCLAADYSSKIALNFIAKEVEFKYDYSTNNTLSYLRLALDLSCRIDEIAENSLPEKLKTFRRLSDLHGTLEFSNSIANFSDNNGEDKIYVKDDYIFYNGNPQPIKAETCVDVKKALVNGYWYAVMYYLKKVSTETARVVIKDNNREEISSILGAKVSDSPAYKAVRRELL